MSLNKSSSEYVKANDNRFGLRVSSTVPHCNKVNRFRDGFTPFATTIKNHVSSQHPVKWAEYKLINLSDDQNAFFDNVPVSFKNLIKAHFPSSSLGAERAMVFKIEKDIVDVIVGDMMFNPSDDIIDSDSQDDMYKPSAFGSDAERNAVLHRQAQQSALAKEQALSLFKRIDGNDNADYAYSVTILKSKTTVFQLAVQYVACGANGSQLTELHVQRST
jgi:hypothetical protein